MPGLAVCSQCSHSARTPDNQIGMRVKCPQCAGAMDVRAERAAIKTTPTAIVAKPMNAAPAPQPRPEPKTQPPAKPAPAATTNLRIACGQCGKAFAAPSHLNGKSVRCPGCSSTIQVGAATPGAAQAAVSPKPTGTRPTPPTINRPAAANVRLPSGPASKPLVTRSSLDDLLGDLDGPSTPLAPSLADGLATLPPLSSPKGASTPPPLATSGRPATASPSPLALNPIALSIFRSKRFASATVVAVFTIVALILGFYKHTRFSGVVFCTTILGIVITAIGLSPLADFGKWPKATSKWRLLSGLCDIFAVLAAIAFALGLAAFLGYLQAKSITKTPKEVAYLAGRFAAFYLRYSVPAPAVLLTGYFCVREFGFIRPTAVSFGVFASLLLIGHALLQDDTAARYAALGPTPLYGVTPSMPAPAPPSWPPPVAASSPPVPTSQPSSSNRRRSEAIDYRQPAKPVAMHDDPQFGKTTAGIGSPAESGATPGFGDMASNSEPKPSPSTPPAKPSGFGRGDFGDTSASTPTTKPKAPNADDDWARNRESLQKRWKDSLTWRTPEESARLLLAKLASGEPGELKRAMKWCPVRKEPRVALRWALGVEMGVNDATGGAPNLVNPADPKFVMPNDRTKEDGGARWEFDRKTDKTGEWLQEGLRNRADQGKFGEFGFDQRPSDQHDHRPLRFLKVNPAGAQLAEATGAGASFMMVIKLIPRGKNDFAASIRIIKVPDGTELWASKPLLASTVASQQKRGLDPVGPVVEEAFAYVDANCKLIDMPTVQFDAVFKRAEKLASQESLDPLLALCELRYYQVSGVLDKDQATQLYGLWLDDAQAKALAGANAERREWALVKLLPTR